jgi:hypothetical protein
VFLWGCLRLLLFDIGICKWQNLLLLKMMNFMEFLNT